MHPFINRLLCFMLAIALVVALAVPVFAADHNGHDLPSISTISGLTYDEYMITLNNGTYRLTAITGLTSSTYKADFQRVYNKFSGDATVYKLTGSTWSFQEKHTNTELATFGVIFSTFDILNEDGSVYMSASVVGYPECDGSSCPATDADHNNICDDCGNVLAYNLRSTLLDYAVSRAETYTAYPYFAVVEHITFEGSYLVYLSQTPMYAEPPEYDTVNGTNLSWFQVNTNEDGSFTHTVRNSSSPWTGNLVYSNHDIENFRKPPLAVVVQGVTGEALEMEIPNLMTETKIIVLCGVGCLALLILLVLLSTKLRRYLKG